MNISRRGTGAPAWRSFVIAASIFTVVPLAFASNITKSFEFGPGTANPTSNVRTFEIPSGLEVAAVVKYRRLGTGKDGIPIEIELREPDTAPGVEGPVAQTQSASATTVEQTVTLRSLASNRGCTKPWRVRVRFAGTGSVPSSVFGTARLDYNGTARTITTQAPGFVGKGTTKVVNMGGTTGLDQGAIGVSANWNHVIGPIQGPNPVKFRVFIVYYPENQSATQVIANSMRRTPRTKQMPHRGLG